MGWKIALSVLVFFLFCMWSFHAMENSINKELREQLADLQNDSRVIDFHDAIIAELPEQEMQIRAVYAKLESEWSKSDQKGE